MSYVVKDGLKNLLEKRFPGLLKAVIGPKRRVQWFIIWRRAGLSISEEMAARRALTTARRFNPMEQPKRDAVAYVGTVPGEGISQLAILIHHGCKPGNTVFEIGCGALNEIGRAHV